MAGEIDVLFSTPDALSLVQAGSLKVYAVTSDTRSALAPDIRTFSEVGLPALSLSGWFALFAPKGTPKEIIDRLNATTVRANSVVRSRLADLGFEIFPAERLTPGALSAFHKAQIDEWWPIIKEFGIKAE